MTDPLLAALNKVEDDAVLYNIVEVMLQLHPPRGPESAPGWCVNCITGPCKERDAIARALGRAAGGRCRVSAEPRWSCFVGQCTCGYEKHRHMTDVHPTPWRHCAGNTFAWYRAGGKVCCETGQPVVGREQRDGEPR